MLSGYKYNPTIGLGGYYVYNDVATGGGVQEGGAPNGAANPDLTWETSEQWDAGIDARFLDNRLSFTFDWYRKITKDLLVDIKPYPEVGVSTMTVNSGEILNTGVDIEVGWRDHVGDFKYSVSANFSPLKNEVQAVNEFLPRYTQGGISGFNQKVQSTFEAGHTIWYFRGFEYQGVYNESNYSLVGDTEVNPKNVGRPIYGGMVPDLNADGSQKTDAEGNALTKWGSVMAPNEDTDMVDLGSGIPKFTYGVTLNLEYKGFDLTVFGTGASGNKIYNLMVSADRPRVNGLNTWWLDSWRKDADGNYTIQGKYPDMNYVAKDWVFFSSSALGYTLPKSITKKFYCNNLRLSVSLDDYFTITSYPGADPETSSFDNGASRGWDNGNYPTSKKLVFGLNVTF